nr:metallophosphoesterase [Dysgonomonas sp. 216]
MLHGNYRFWNPVVTEVDISIDKKASKNQLKVVVVSDIHVGYLINKDVLKMYVDRIMAQNADLILIVGDIIDYDLRPLIEERHEEEFRRLKAPYGVYAVTGNHEYRLNSEEKIKWLSEKADLTVLRDQAICVDSLLCIVGREDYKAPDRRFLYELMADVNKDLPVIVINHEPHDLDEEVENGVDLAVYGHTHNGQLFPNNLLIKFLYELGFGYKKKEDTNIYVTSGLGLSGPQYRIGTISEIVVFNLKFKN